MRYVQVALLWGVAAATTLLSLFAAWLGRADWGDGGASQMPVAEAVALVVLAAVAPVAAWWLARKVLC
ncbi:hypothetical protein [Nocardioides baculatus]|uniref:Uncharacterized protein n=1 Tax=Nocardioides baculatus TaxID=2801337 RepID=A0ABS1LDG4_9ACTN|nr:hypothetical protein [Nocardioides baculatus]MBL0749607.1 hypothetical protein [Nocardioides baculatus]